MPPVITGTQHQKEVTAWWLFSSGPNPSQTRVIEKIAGFWIGQLVGKKANNPHWFQIDPQLVNEIWSAFMKTVGIATSAGYDCDNQAATCGGLLGFMLGAKAIPAALTRECAPDTRWEKPFNDTHINYSRDGLPIHNRICDLVERIAKIA